MPHSSNALNNVGVEPRDVKASTVAAEAAARLFHFVGKQQHSLFIKLTFTAKTFRSNH